MDHCSGCGAENPATQDGVNSDYTVCCNEGVCNDDSGAVNWNVGPADEDFPTPTGTIRACCAPRAELLTAPGTRVLSRRW